MEKKDLKPAEVFMYFEKICQVPRPSKKEGKIIAYLQNFGKEHGLETRTDKAGNVLIRKPATRGMEQCKTVALQAHMDMVCEKNNDVQHDFQTDPIETEIDGEWMTAKGTTLGADNGIGIATALAILADSSIEHGPLECLFTVDEETGLTGAFALEDGFMNADILLNLDSEDEGELFIGCAGGVDSVGEFTYQDIDVPQGYFYAKIQIKGLKGGHSGGDIHLGRACANKLLARFLIQASNRHDMYLCEIDGGNLRNAIAREASAVIVFDEALKEQMRVSFNMYAAEMEQVWKLTEPELRLEMESTDLPDEVLDADSASHLLNALYACPHGVFSMSYRMPGMVETSTNLAAVKFTNGNTILITTSQRSDVDSEKMNIAQMVASVFRLAGAAVEHGEGYPGWAPNPDSPILKIAVESYEALFGQKPVVRSIHAGLECGLFLEKYPGMDMISFGPTLRGVHSPDEKVNIATVEKWWRHLVDILERLK